MLIGKRSKGTALRSSGSRLGGWGNFCLSTGHLGERGDGWEPEKGGEPKKGPGG